GGPEWVAPVTLTLLLHLALFAGYLGAFHWDPSALVCVDAKTIGEYPFEHVTTGFDKGGHDGQFYYALARDPWTPRADDFDNLAVRRSRPLYYLLGYAAGGGGHPVALLWALPAINLAVLVGLAWLGATWATRHGRSAMWGVLLPIVVNAGTPALRDLTDPLSAFTVAGLLVAYLLGWRSWVVGLWA